MLSQPVLRRQAAVLPLPHCHRLPVRAAGGELLWRYQTHSVAVASGIALRPDEQPAIVRLGQSGDVSFIVMYFLFQRGNLPCLGVY